MGEGVWERGGRGEGLVLLSLLFALVFLWTLLLSPRVFANHFMYFYEIAEAGVYV